MHVCSRPLHVDSLWRQAACRGAASNAPALSWFRKRQTPEGRVYGASLVGVGVGSMTYHASHGR